METIHYAKSPLLSTKALTNKNAVSFHRCQRMCFNRDVLNATGIHEGMYATFKYVDLDRKTIVMYIATTKKHSFCMQSQLTYTKRRNPRVDNRHTYCYIRTTDLLFRHKLLCYGTFSYSVRRFSSELIKLVIYL